VARRSAEAGADHALPSSDSAGWSLPSRGRPSRRTNRTARLADRHVKPYAKRHIKGVRGNQLAVDGCITIPPCGARSPGAARSTAASTAASGPLRWRAVASRSG
jgi:hypothetical protein